MTDVLVNSKCPFCKEYLWKSSEGGTICKTVYGNGDLCQWEKNKVKEED